ncbi:glycosyltransferase [Staphylococcus massiliensis]|uniref:Glycosyl transferase family 1 domain-containing protein n=1 Tax=Staphylococcus massiliensis S46 TaxID=1229783 RepID=K9AKB0_9STAP|nr:glycosyltransferase [Staphylococcus massiliensis]EKU47778.1 hypothetical protein C273_07037 [Staphylococcus massiliensis S46]MCG3399805.1 glycosyltransferase [Staphylococcus massiliensis]MCG3401542.1 glycosyltransferase [Staphylococcus massiliensis]PNZ98034.1 glycosyltransferase family 1 protein [Staphylococcus massiliensis CCUG 55927]
MEQRERKRILVTGFINVNVLDGSSVFMSSITQVLASDSDIEVDLLLAVPFNRDVVLKKLEAYPNVNIIDPFEDVNNKDFDFFKRNYMTREEYAYLIDRVFDQGNYDHMFIRALEVVEYMVEHNSNAISSMFAYITGVTSSKQEIDSNIKALLSYITSKGAYLLCQTDEMKQHINKQCDLSKDRIIDLNPMIPDQNLSFNDVFKKKPRYDKFCYTGKFAHEWNIIPMITQFRELNEMDDDVKLYIAGDQFKKSPENPNFVSHASYLIQNSPNVMWLGALTRDQTLALVEQCDVGLTYRSEALSDSLELSTKLLEYCSFGVPPVLNRTKMHERIFGEDYPYFANTDEEFYLTMKKVVDEPKLLESTAQHVFEIAKGYSFSATYSKMAKYIFNNNTSVEHKFNIISSVYESNEAVYDSLNHVYAFNIYQDIAGNIRHALKKGKIENSSIIQNVVILNIDDKTRNTESEILDVSSKLYKEIISRATNKQINKVNIDELQSPIQQPNKPSSNDNQVQVLQRKYNKLAREFRGLKRKYNNLSNSKLGSLQKRYWNFKKSKNK